MLDGGDEDCFFRSVDADGCGCVSAARSSYRSGDAPVTAASLDSGLSGSAYSLLDEEGELNEVDSAIFQVPRLWANSSRSCGSIKARGLTRPLRLDVFSLSSALICGYESFGIFQKFFGNITCATIWNYTDVLFSRSRSRALLDINSTASVCGSHKDFCVLDTNKYKIFHLRPTTVETVCVVWREMGTGLHL